MEFEWDEDKRLQNIVKHGLDFLRIRSIFDGRPVLTTQSDFIAEERWITTAELDGNVCSVVWTLRGETIRIISARRARDAEEREYRSLHRRTNR